MELTKLPINYMEITEEDKLNKIHNFLESFEDHEDVQKVYTNL